MVSLLNNLIVLFIQAGIKSSFCIKCGDYKGKNACHFYSYDGGICVTNVILFLTSVNMKLN